MRKLMISFILVLVLSAFPARAHETDVPHEEIRSEATTPAVENTNAGVTQPKKRADFRAKPALKPLLLIPLALGLYLVYEKLSVRK